MKTIYIINIWRFRTDWELKQLCYVNESLTVSDAVLSDILSIPWIFPIPD